MNTKEFKTLVETLDLEDGLKEKVLELVEPKGELVPGGWDEDIHSQREVVDEDGEKYILLDISTLTNRYYAVPLDEDGDLAPGGGTYLDIEKPLYFTGRKMALARADVPEDIEDIEPGERFVGEYCGLKAILVRNDSDDLPWIAHTNVEYDLGYAHEVKLHRRLVEV